MLWIPFFKYQWLSKKWLRLRFSKKLLPLNLTWRYCFFLFYSHDPKQKKNHQISSSRAKPRSTQSQTCVMHKGNIICNKRNTDGNTGDLKILHKKCPNKVNFLDVIFNFSKILCGLPSTLCLTGELWPLLFIWHHDLRVNHCQSSAMTVVFTQYSFCNSFKHSLLCMYIMFMRHLSPKATAKATMHSRLVAQDRHFYNFCNIRFHQKSSVHAGQGPSQWHKQTHTRTLQPIDWISLGANSVINWLPMHVSYPTPHIFPY